MQDSGSPGQPRCTGCCGLLLLKTKPSKVDVCERSFLLSGKKCSYLRTGKASAMVAESEGHLLREPPAGPSLEARLLELPLWGPSSPRVLFWEKWPPQLRGKSPVHHDVPGGCPLWSSSLRPSGARGPFLSTPALIPTCFSNPSPPPALLPSPGPLHVLSLLRVSLSSTLSS